MQPTHAERQGLARSDQSAPHEATRARRAHTCERFPVACKVPVNHEELIRRMACPQLAAGAEELFRVLGDIFALSGPLAPRGRHRRRRRSSSSSRSAESAGCRVGCSLTVHWLHLRKSTGACKCRRLLVALTSAAQPAWRGGTDACGVQMRRWGCVGGLGREGQRRGVFPSGGKAASGVVDHTT